MSTMIKSVEIEFGDVRKKELFTPNHFVTHMVEHIAWRLGVSIQLSWADESWRELGKALGEKIRALPRTTERAEVLGMIDDGSAQVTVVLPGVGAEITATDGIDLDWFLNGRCEQIDTGRPLIELLNGVSEGIGARIGVEIWNLEDPHHTWEGVFRGVGIALGKIFAPTSTLVTARDSLGADAFRETFEGAAEVQVLERGVQRATVRRGTAETGITVAIDLASAGASEIVLDVDGSIRDAISDAPEILDMFLRGIGASARIDFKATKLSSSHVVMEDIGLVLGRALLEIMKVRMERHGINGAGSSVSMNNRSNKLVDVGVSIEGRKFWRLVPFDGDAATLKKRFVIGGDILNGLRSEDLDDFLDGLSGGMSASIMVHIRDASDVSRAWQELFSSLGLAVKEAFGANPFRKGVPPGVKATLA